MAVHYLEIVSDDADTLTALYQRLHSLAFGPPDPDLGQARVAMRADGTLVGIRTPLAAHERPIVRTYLAVDDIHRGRMRPRPTARRLPIPRRGRASGAPLPS